MDQFRRYHSVRHTTTNPRNNRSRVTYSTPFGLPPVSNSANPTSGGRSSPEYYEYPTSSSTNRTPDWQPHHSDRDTSRIHRHHSVSASTRYTPDQQPRPSDRDTVRYVSYSVSPSTNHTQQRQPSANGRNASSSHVEQATSEPEMPLEAVKLFLVVMCEGTERYYDEYETRRAAKNLAQDLEHNFGVRLSADRLLQKYELLKDNHEIRHIRPGPEEHDLILALHRRRIRELEEEREREEENERLRRQTRPRQFEEQDYRRPTRR